MSDARREKYAAALCASDGFDWEEIQREYPADVESYLRDADAVLVVADEELRARDIQIVVWLGKKAREYRSTGSRQHALQAGAIEVMASKIDRGAVR